MTERALDILLNVIFLVEMMVCLKTAPWDLEASVLP
jgi:hypothetical protein